MCVQLYKTLGCKVWSLSQGYRPGGKRHGTTRQTKGLPDLWVVPPRARLAEQQRYPWWQETKRDGGKQSPEQLAFQDACEAAGVTVVVGGLAEAQDHCEAIGLMRRAR